MLNLIIALALILAILWTGKKFYFPTEFATHPERYPVRPDAKVSKRELGIVMAQLQRWRSEGKITREEYDHLTDICLSEMQQLQ